jgi:hypothetical protein
MNVETKEQSKQWMHTHSPDKPKKFKQMLSARKLMAAVFLDRKRVMMVEFMQQGTTILSEVYCMQNNKKLHRAIQKKRCGILTSGVVLLHDNMHPYTAASIRAVLEHFNWELFDHPLHSPDLSSSGCHLKACLESQHFSSNEELVEGVKMWLRSQTSDFFDTGI